MTSVTFPDGTFDLVATQDVFEHLFDPFGAEREILRTLRPGGLHVFSCPIVLKNLPSRRRANLVDGQVVHFLERQYRGNPIDEAGSLVTIDGGYDIVAALAAPTGAPQLPLLFR
jgi:SAM-dependent methyltransferase